MTGARDRCGCSASFQEEMSELGEPEAGCVLQLFAWVLWVHSERLLYNSSVPAPNKCISVSHSEVSFLNKGKRKITCGSAPLL